MPITATKNTEIDPAQFADEHDATWRKFLAVLALIERLHRLLLDVIKDDMVSKNQTDINAVQALLLFHVGPNEFSATELRQRGYYQGSNVSYNLKKLVDAGYVNNDKNPNDRRALQIRLTQKGEEMRQNIESLYERMFMELIESGTLFERDFHITKDNLFCLERYFQSKIRHIY